MFLLLCEHPFSIVNKPGSRFPFSPPFSATLVLGAHATHRLHLTPLAPVALPFHERNTTPYTHAKERKKERKEKRMSHFDLIAFLEICLQML
jgi:hypothetical protein